MNIGGRQKTALVVRETAWDATLAISTRRLAAGLLDLGWAIQWVNPVRMPRSWSDLVPGTTIDHPAPGLTTVEPVSPISLSPRMPEAITRAAPAAWRTARPRLRSLPTPDVLVLSHPKSLGLASMWPGLPVVWQVTDHYPDRSSHPDRIRLLLAATLPKADRVVAVNAALAEHLADVYSVPRHRLDVIGHGAPNPVVEPRSGTDPFDDGTDRRRVVYVGTIGESDVEAMSELARSPDHRLILIGPDDSIPANLRSLAGVTIDGPCPSDRLVDRLAWCDVGLIAYRGRGTDRHRFTTPMKAHDYAAAGLPIVSGLVESLADAPCVPWADGESLISVVDRAHAERMHRRVQVLDWARSNSWARRTEEFEVVLDGAIAAAVNQST